MKPTLAAALVVAIAACSAGRMHRASATDPLPAPADPRAEIEALDRQITADRVALGDGPSGDSMTAAELTAQCDDTCRLRDSICHSADRICDLAGQLVDDSWAAERCTAGKASCATATERCDGCRAE